MIDLPSLGLVIGSAAVDAINPFTIGVMLLILAVILGSGHSNKRLFGIGGAYIFSLFLGYVIIGLAFAYVFSAVSPLVADYLALGVGLLTVLAGLIEIKDYFWYGNGPSLQVPARYSAKIHKWAKRRVTLGSALSLGFFVTVISLPYNGAPYLAVMTLLREAPVMITLLYAVIFSAVFVLPLKIILLAAAKGTKLSTITKWKEESKATMRLFMGVLLIALGWMLLLAASGTINFR